jgi:DNA-binding transcriptional ArsR family regulator
METTSAVSVLNALAQETRLAIYRMLVRSSPEGVAAGRIGTALAIAPATLSFHLRELSHAGLVHARQRSRFIYYSADVATVSELLAFLAATCCPENGAPQGAPAAPAPIAPHAAKPVVRPKTSKA